MPMPDSTPRVSVIIPNWNGARWLPGCLGGLARQTFRDFEIVIVDNGSTDDSINLIHKTCATARVVPLPSNCGFAVACNRGLAESRGAHIVLLNNDTVPQPEWLANLVRAIDRNPPEVCAVTSLMLDMENPELIENAGVALHWDGLDQKIGFRKSPTEFDQPRDVFAASAGAAIYRRGFLEELGGFDEKFVMYLEDVDLCLRGRILGYRCVLEPSAIVLHHGHGSGLPTARYVRLITRNRLLMLLKNIPLTLRWRHAGKLLYGQWYFCLAQGRPLASLLGCLGFLPLIPYGIRERRKLWRNAKISAEDLDRMLPPDSGLPPLRAAIRKRLGGKAP